MNPNLNNICTSGAPDHLDLDCVFRERLGASSLNALSGMLGKNLVVVRFIPQEWNLLLAGIATHGFSWQFAQLNFQHYREPQDVMDQTLQFGVKIEKPGYNNPGKPAERVPPVLGLQDILVLRQNKLVHSLPVAEANSQHQHINPLLVVPGDILGSLHYKYGKTMELSQEEILAGNYFARTFGIAGWI